MLRARQNGGGTVRGGKGRGNGNGSPGGRGNNSNPEVASIWDPANKGSGVVLSNGNLTANVGAADYPNLWALSDTTRSSGKLYFEILVGTQTNGNGQIGIIGAAQNPNSASTTAPYRLQSGGGGSGPGGVNGSAWWNLTNPVVGVAVDVSAGTCQFYLNGVANGSSAVAAISGPFKIYAWQADGSPQTYLFTIRTTTASFSYSPPSGYISWASGT